MRSVYRINIFYIFLHSQAVMVVFCLLKRWHVYRYLYMRVLITLQNNSVILAVHADSACCAKFYCVLWFVYICFTLSPKFIRFKLAWLLSVKGISHLMHPEGYWNGEFLCNPSSSYQGRNYTYMLSHCIAGNTRVSWKSEAVVQ